MIGFFIGSIQSSSRTALISLSKKKILTHYLEFMLCQGKITNFLGPLLVATFTYNF